MKLLQEIRQQPEHIRHIMMWLCVVTTFSLVALVWFRTTQQRLVAMLHPAEKLEAPAGDRFADRDLRKMEEERTRQLAEARKAPSPLASIFNSFNFLRASIGELLGTSQELNQPKENKVEKKNRATVLRLDQALFAKGPGSNLLFRCQINQKLKTQNQKPTLLARRYRIGRSFRRWRSRIWLTP